MFTFCDLGSCFSVGQASVPLDRLQSAVLSRQHHILNECLLFCVKKEDKTTRSSGGADRNSVFCYSV